jgi:hypothetical protein
MNFTATGFTASQALPLLPPILQLAATASHQLLSLYFDDERLMPAQTFIADDNTDFILRKMKGMLLNASHCTMQRTPIFCQIFTKYTHRYRPRPHRHDIIYYEFSD